MSVGPVIGIIGAGQLGRMLALAGTRLGARFAFYEDVPSTTAHTLGPCFAQDQLDAFIDTVDVVTFESENTPIALIERISQRKPVMPNATALFTAQHRGREKTLFRTLGIETAPFMIVDSLAALHEAVATIGLPAVLKTTTEGYDGKGQAVLRHADDVLEAWQRIGGRELILEGFVQFNRELSIIAARSRTGDIVFYPLVENTHIDGILRLTLAPAPALSNTLTQQAQAAISAVMTKLDYVGVLALELFDTDHGLVANEMAPRVHNSGHWSQDGAWTDQFENHCRALLDLPLGDAGMEEPCAAMINLIGELGDWQSTLSIPHAKVHLYDKAPRPGRKLGHINITATTSDNLMGYIEQVKKRVNAL
ncbi:MAG: 5-(carboxyamino)imidazole ribonucleotide synthase [Thiotrichales bacterium]|jgi:5-(carboxyamino)imidazole ribonucleotide synthase|nr:5-(carboxyamino)imidazole ribonucleotide synthase [Thiotrichales bacterium]